MNIWANSALAFPFLTGLLVGGAVRWSYVRFLKATIRFYEHYIQERIDEQGTAQLERNIRNSG